MLAKKRREFAFKNVFDLSQIFEVLGIIWKCSKSFTIYRLILTGLMAVLPLIPLYLMKLILDAFVADTKPTFNYLMTLVLIYLGVKVLTMILSNILNYVTMRQTDLVIDRMSMIVIDKAMKTDLEYFDSDIYHDIYQRALAQSGGRPLQIFGVCLSFFQNAITLIAIIGMLMTVHWSLIFVLVVITTPVAVVRWIYTGKSIELIESQTQDERKSGYFKGVMTQAQYAKEVRIFDFGKELLPVFLNMRTKIRKEKRLFYIKQNISISAAQIIEVIGIMAALAYIINRTLLGDLTVGDIALYFGIVQKGQSSVGGFLRSFVSIQENKLFVSHLFQFLDLKTKITETKLPTDINKPVKKLVVENLHFTYPGTKKEIIRDISLDAKAGDVVAIVGKNGSGKTTLVKLISRLYEPDKGSIKLDGIDIKNISIKDLRKKFTIIFQQFAKYNATVNENIYYADIGEKYNREKIVNASDNALANEFINKLPQKYQTALGRSFRAGEELSGGQWQKIALSRAFFKDADIVVLDEPTSFIDPIAEDKIFRNLLKIAKEEQKIMVLITHRIYNLKQADKIIVLEKGEIKEVGSHTELMNKNGLYKKMFDSQSV